MKRTTNLYESHLGREVMRGDATFGYIESWHTHNGVEGAMVRLAKPLDHETHDAFYVVLAVFLPVQLPPGFEAIKKKQINTKTD